MDIRLGVMARSAHALACGCGHDGMGWVGHRLAMFCGLREVVGWFKKHWAETGVLSGCCLVCVASHDVMCERCLVHLGNAGLDLA